MTAVFEGSYAQGKRFSNVNAPGLTFTAIEFEECVFDRCLFVEGVFERCKFTGCRFVNCDLSLVKVTNSTFVDTRFEKSKLVGIDWTKGGNAGASKLLMSVHFMECVLDYASFAGLRVPAISMARCRAHHAVFAEADLSGADLSGTDFTDSTFHNTNLQKANLTGATNYAIDPNANRIKQARFSLPEAVALLRGFDIVIDE